MQTYQPDFITHYYRKGTLPFQSLSSLPDDKALEIMRALCDETLFGARFKDPEHYLHNRRQSEKWVREQFILKGGRPLLKSPIYFVLGESRWLMENSPDRLLHQEVQIKLADFEEGDVSFTYPDSMISFWFEKEKPTGLYNTEFHGKIITRQEILAIVEQKGDPEKDWQPRLPPNLAPYIETQVWNLYPLLKYV